MLTQAERCLFNTTHTKAREIVGNLKDYKLNDN